MRALAALVALGGRDQTTKLSAIREVKVKSSFLSGEKAVLMNASPRKSPLPTNLARGTA